MATTFSEYHNGPMDRYELRHIMWTWPILMRQTTDPNVLNFACQMWEKHSNANWLPTLRQGQWMRALHREITEQDEVIELIEN